jgi:hypothetical protein
MLNFFANDKILVISYWREGLSEFLMSLKTKYKQDNKAANRHKQFKYIIINTSSVQLTRACNTSSVLIFQLQSLRKILFLNQ